MMLFNKENGKEKVYVQYQDIMELINGDFNFSIPCFLIDKLFKNDKALLVDDSNNIWMCSIQMNFFYYSNMTIIRCIGCICKHCTNTAF